jgi:hypothetical protein
MKNKDKKIDGFDYLKQTEVHRSKKEWRESIKNAIADGGSKRHKEGETFIYGKNHLIITEIYELL